MQDCDLFETGDKVWCIEYGFGVIHDKDKESGMLRVNFNGYSHCITPNGRHWQFDHRPRTIYHAVDNNDIDMNAAIARGEGLKRPAPRGRWPIEVGDRVMLVTSGGITCVNRAKDRGFACERDIEVAGAAITNMGIFFNTGSPIAMVLRDKEEPFESALENLRWIMDEAIKFGWHEKYGKK